MPSYPSTAIDKSYISSIYFLDKRDILNKVLDVTNEDPSFLDIMDAWRRRIPTSSAKFHHYVNEPYYPIITSGSDDNWAALGVKVGDIVTITSTGTGAAEPTKQYYAKDPTAMNTGAVPLDGGTAPAALGGESFVITSNAHGEGSAGPAPIRYGLKKYEAKAQIFKKSYQLTDIELGNAIEVEFNGRPYYMYKAQHDTLLTYKVDISSALMWGANVGSAFSGWDDDRQSPPSVDISGSNVTDPTGNTVQFTRGLHDWSINDGLDLSGVTGTTALDILAEVSKVMNVVRCPSAYKLIVGTEANIKMDDDIKALNVTGGSANGHRVDVNGQSINFNLDTFQLYGRKWEKMWMPMIDHETGQAYLGADHSKSVYLCPDTPIKVIGEQGTVDRMRVRYLEGSGMSFGYREMKLGGLAPQETDSRSVFEVVYESVQGLQLAGSEHFGYTKIG